MNEPTEMVECVVCGFVPKHKRRKLKGELRLSPSTRRRSVTSACRCGRVDYFPTLRGINGRARAAPDTEACMSEQRNDQSK